MMHFFHFNIKIKSVFIHFLFLLLPFLGFAKQNPEQLFRRANEFYKNKDFKKAAELYESVEKQGLTSAALYYNLGNSYFRIGNTPKAILNYERAKKLSPDDEDLQYNLKIANLSVTDKIEPLPELEFSHFIKSFVNTYSSAGWAVWAIALLWLSLATAALFILSNYRNLKKTGFYTAIISFALFVVFILISLQRRSYENKDFAIIFSAVSYVKTAPEAQSKDAFYLHAGTKVEIRETLGDWSYIRIADGKTGWLKREYLEVI
jgi:tetratricopeptide (TPR) repeat protein